MNKVSLILTTVLTLSLVVVIAPNIFAANQGKILRNIAIWLAIFVGLGLIYQNFGPGSAHPLFAAPEAMAPVIRTAPHPLTTIPADTPGTTPTATPTPEDKSDDGNNDGAQGFTPPKE